MKCLAAAPSGTWPLGCLATMDSRSFEQLVEATAHAPGPRAYVVLTALVGALSAALILAYLLGRLSLPVMPPAKRRPWDLPDLALFVGIHLMLMVAAGSLHAELAPEAGGRWRMALIAVVQLVSGGFVVLYLVVVHRVELRDWFGRHPLRGLWTGVRAWMSIAALLLATNMGYQWLFRRCIEQAPDYNPVMLEFLSGSDRLNESLLLLQAIVIAPVIEELFFRGCLQPVLCRYIGRWPGILVGALLFGLIHPPINILPIILLGVALGDATERSGTLWVPIGMHMVHNAWTMLYLVLIKVSL